MTMRYNTLTKAIELKPELTPKPMVLPGLAYGGQGEYDHAIEYSTKAIELKPDYANAYYAALLAAEYDRATKTQPRRADDRGHPRFRYQGLRLN